jgi:tRNA-Thr(GGU) m(6)t(6)A37 methyltransferase TsaA
MPTPTSISRIPFKLSLEPIGFVHSPYHDKYAAPRQPLPLADADDSTIGASIELFPHRNYDQALSDLAGFDRIWLVTWFNQNCRPDGTPIWKPKVLTPRGRAKRGVFATRSPHRPNTLGISVVRLVAVKGLIVHIAECDVLDGTPVLDLKPYIPLYDSFPESRVGWLADEFAREPYTLVFTPLTDEYLRTSKASATDIAGLRHYLRAVLERDPYPHPYRRINARPDGTFELAMKLWRVAYRVVEAEQKTILVERVWQVEAT